jgi:chromosome segregation ATPase
MFRPKSHEQLRQDYQKHKQARGSIDAQAVIQEIDDRIERAFYDGYSLAYKEMSEAANKLFNQGEANAS